MINYLNQKINFLIIILSAAAILSGCSNDDKNKPAAKVDDQVLTDKDISYLLDSSSFKNYNRDELIREWVELQLLYKEAEAENILTSKEYTTLINVSKSKLAANLLLEKVTNNKKFTLSNEDYHNYYNDNQSEFTLLTESYLVNNVFVDSEEKAVEVRNSIIENGWQSEVLRNNKIKFEENKLIDKNSYYTPEQVNLIKGMLDKEVSIVLKNENTFYLFYLVKKLKQGSIPPYEGVKDLVKDRAEALAKENFIREYIKNLYQKYEVELKEVQ